MDTQNNIPTANPMEVAVRDLCGKVDAYLKQGCLRSELYHVNERVKALLDTLPEQKPAEWSDTNELVFQDICKHLKEEGYNGWIEILEALHSGELKQPIAEWSEEDERMRNQLIYDVEYHKKEGLISAKQNKATKTLYNEIEKCYDEKIAWLKSLRPSWKPSEEPPVEGLEEEIRRYLSEECSGDDEPLVSEIARHFAEWGASHAKTPTPFASSPVPGEVHHALNVHYIITDQKELNSRLKEFPEGARVDVYIEARNSEDQPPTP